MHVGCDAAECHHHILGYLKIDLPAFVCVYVFTAPSHTGPVVVYCPFLFFILSRSHFARASSSHAVLQCKKWS